VTTDAMAAMGLGGVCLEVGAPAHLVVLGEPDVREALRTHAAPRYVVSHGRLVDRAAMEVLAGERGRHS